MFPSHDNDFCDGMPTDGAAAQLAEEQQRRHRNEDEERKARRAEEMAAAVKGAEERRAATAARTEAEYAHNIDMVRNGNFDVMAVVPLDYENICAGQPDEFVVVVGADEKLFTSERPHSCSLTTAMTADGAQIGTLQRTQTGVRVLYGTPTAAGDGGGVSEEFFHVIPDGQDEPDNGAWNLIESLHFGVILTAPAPPGTTVGFGPAAPTALTVTLTAQAAAPTPVGTPATHQTNTALPSPATAPAAATAPSGTPATERRTSPPASRHPTGRFGGVGPMHLPAKVGHGATAGYVLGPRALGGVAHGNFWDGDHVRLKREAAPSTQISAADRKYKLVNRGGTKVLYVGWQPGLTTANQNSYFLPISETSLLFDRVSAQQAANLEVALGVAWIRSGRVYRTLAAGDWVKVSDDGAVGPRFGKLVACLRDDRQSGLGSSWRGWVMVPDVAGSKFVFVNNDAIEQVSVVCCRMLLLCALLHLTLDA